MGQFLFGMDSFLYMLAAEPRAVHRFLDRVVEIHLANLERFLGAVGDSIDIIVFGDDMGMQTGPQFSPAMYREFFKPRHARLWARAKELAPVKVMLHCCGGVRELLPDLIDAGLDAINPVQSSCAGMEPAGLKRDFGRGPGLLGRRLRHPGGAARRHAGAGARARARARAHPGPRGRVRFPAGAQHPGLRAPRERRGHAGLR